MSKQAVNKRVKTFSEEITTGSKNKTTAVFIEAGRVLTPRGPLKMRTPRVEEAINNLRGVLRGTQSPVKVEKAVILTKQWRAKINTETFLKTILKDNQKLQQQEHRYLSQILGTDFPTVKGATRSTTEVGKTVKKAIPKPDQAEKILKIVAKESKSLRKILTKTLIKKIIPKILPLLGIGLVAIDLTSRVRKMLGKNVPDEFGEVNPRVALGENYHCSVGWY